MTLIPLIFKNISKIFVLALLLQLIVFVQNFYLFFSNKHTLKNIEIDAYGLDEFKTFLKASKTVKVWCSNGTDCQILYSFCFIL